MLVQSVVSHIREILRDYDADQYTDEFIYDAILNAELAIHSYRPDSTSTQIQVDCVLGSRQSLPLNATQLLSMQGNISGRSINRTTESSLNSFTPNWKAETPVSEAIEYTYDEREKRIFYLNPPVLAGSSVLLIASLTPQPYGTVDATTQTTVSDEYRQPLTEYALYNLFSADTEGTPNLSRSAQHLSNFANFLGIEWQAIRNQSPKQVSYDK